MPTSNNSLPTVSPVNKPWGAFMLVVSLVGFLDATYLTLKHYQGAIPPCTVHGCETVLTSRFATVGPVPVSLLGAAFYVTILLGTLLYLDSKKTATARLVAKLTTLGFLASLYFFGLQWLVIKAWCQYCLLSVTTSTLLFAGGLWLLRRKTPPAL